MVETKPNVKVRYLSAERFECYLNDAICNNTIEEFKAYYVSLDLLLIDDIQFLRDKEQAQNLLNQIINAMLATDRQVILTSDCMPEKIKCIDEPLRKCLEQADAINIGLPDLFERAEILTAMAKDRGFKLADDIALFIAKELGNTNTRVLEGAIAKIYANAKYTGQSITNLLVKDSLKDMLSVAHLDKKRIENKSLFCFDNHRKIF